MMRHFRYTNNIVRSLLILFTLTLLACLKADINPASGTPAEYIPLLDIKKLYKGTDVQLTVENMSGATKVTGVVISDAASGNIPKGNLVIQQTSRSFKRGIELAFGAELNYKMGDSVSIDIAGATLTRSKGVLQITNIGLSKVSKLAENIPLQPTQLALGLLNSKFADYESTLIKVTNVDAHTASATLAGDCTLQEVGGGKAILHTEVTASFADRKVPVNASYTGIARWNNETGNGIEGAVKQLWPNNVNSIEDESGALYENFPEDFENGNEAILATGYGTKTGTFQTGAYTLTNATLGREINDYPVSGVYSLRFNQNSTSNAFCTMNYDLPNGASKVTVWAGSYGASADLGSTWRLEYSQNQGISWSQVSDDILTISKAKKQFTFLMDIRGPVRFRIGKIGIGASTTNNQNGRFSMDDFAIYRNPEGGGPVADPIPEYETVTGWQFATPATTGSETTVNASVNHPGLTTGVISRGTGFNVATYARGFGSNAAGPVIPSTKSLAVSGNAYFQTVITVKPGFKLSLSAIDVKVRRSGAGARSHKWFYSFDGMNFKETIGSGDVFYEGVEGDGLFMPTSYIYKTTELQNIPAGTTVTLRMYCWGMTNINSGSFAIGRSTDAASPPVLALGGKVEPQ